MKKRGKKMEQKLYTTQETAEILRVSLRTLFNYIKQGKIKPIKVGGIKKVGKNLIPKSEIDKILSN